MKIGNRIRAAVTCAVLGLGGCGAVPPDATITSDAEGCYLLAVSVNGYRPSEPQVTMSEGHMVDGKFVTDFSLMPAFVNLVQDGYVLGKAKAGALVGLTSFAPQWGAPKYEPNCGIEVIEVKGGVVSYATDIAFSAHSTGGTPQYKNDFEAAKRFMHKYHPALEDKLVQGTFQTRKLSTAPRC